MNAKTNKSSSSTSPFPDYIMIPHVNLLVSNLEFIAPSRAISRDNSRVTRFAVSLRARSGVGQVRARSHVRSLARSLAGPLGRKEGRGAGGGWEKAAARPETQRRLLSHASMTQIRRIPVRRILRSRERRGVARRSFGASAEKGLFLASRGSYATSRAPRRAPTRARSLIRGGAPRYVATAGPACRTSARAVALYWDKVAWGP